jgi:hypothetical protein
MVTIVEALSVGVAVTPTYKASEVAESVFRAGTKPGECSRVLPGERTAGKRRVSETAHNRMVLAYTADWI